MKSIHILLSVTVLALSFTASAQIPQGFTYQSVVRDTSGNPSANIASLPVKFSILKAAVPVYVETHTGSTNKFGLLTLTVGQGTATTGTFSALDWSTGAYSLKVEINFGSGFVNMGTNTLLTVPFAMAAKNITSGVLKDTDGDTKVQVEESPDEDKIRFDLGGTERWVMTETRLEPASNSIFIGRAAGTNDSLGSNANIFIGDSAGFSNTLGYNNTATGYDALISNTEGGDNTAIGYQALYKNTSGFSNAAIGSYSLYGNTTGYSNTAIGTYTLLENTAGYYNTAVGSGALAYSTTGNYNTAIGSVALYFNTTGSDNTANGNAALYFNTTGSDNTANGESALYFNTTGSNNTANGEGALYFNNAGLDNTATGRSALYSNSTGNYNTAIGKDALAANTVGTANTGSGLNALRNNTTGSYNTGYGVNALYSNGTTSFNTACGYEALMFTTVSENNTAVGCYAGRDYNNGFNNVFVGATADVNANGLYNVIAVGQGTVVSASSTARFGNAATVSYGGWAGWTNVSDGRYKKNINENVPGLQFISKLRPVTYHLDASGLDAFLHKDEKQEERLSASAKAVHEGALQDKEKILYTGFVAQEVEAAARELGFDFSGVDAAKNENDVYGLRYAEFVVPLVKAVQEQQEMITQMQREITLLKEALNAGAGADGDIQEE